MTDVSHLDDQRVGARLADDGSLTGSPALVATTLDHETEPLGGAPPLTSEHVPPSAP